MPTTLHEVPDVAPPQISPKRDANAEPRSRPRARLTPDEEAMQLMLKVVERVEVAKSFAKIAAGIVSVSAARAGVQLRAVADAKMSEAATRAAAGDGGVLGHVDTVRKIARAAKDAALHVATHRPEPASPPAPPAPPAPADHPAAATAAQS